MSITYISRLWPNGEFSVGLAPKTSQDPLRQKPQPELHIDEFNTLALGVHGFDKTWEFAVGGSPLGLSQVPKTPTRAQRGLKGIPTNGCRMVRNAAHMQEQHYGLRRLGMLTVTLPNLDDEDHLRVHQNWSEIIRIFKKWLYRRLDKQIDTVYIVGVTEIQEERYESTKKIWNHAHILFPARDVHNRRFLIPADDFRSAWGRAVSSHTTGVYDWSASVDCTMLRTSAAGYIGKYCTKGRGFVSTLDKDAYSDYLPRSWYFLDNGLRGVVKRAIRVNAIPEQWLMANGGQAVESGFLAYHAYIEIDPPKDVGEEGWRYGKRIVGCVGRVHLHNKEELIRMKETGGIV